MPAHLECHKLLRLAALHVEGRKQGEGRERKRANDQRERDRGSARLKCEGAKNNARIRLEDGKVKGSDI